VNAIVRIVVAWVWCLGSVLTTFAALPGPPRVAQVTPAPGQVTALTSITVTFSEEVTGIAPADLLINGVAVANTVTGSGTTYVFELASQPPHGSLQVSWDAGHAIVDFDIPPTRFDETHAASSWQYNLIDQVAPTVATRTPVAGASVRTLTQIEVLFSEPVAGVDAGDLLINGAAASGISVTGSGRYLFTFPQPANGTVSVAWAPAHGIADFAANPFAGGSWSYTLDPNLGLPQIRINEFLAANVTGLADEDLPPEPQDWIEIWNYGTSTVNLNGYALTDDPEDPGRWTFPSTNLAPGQFLVVFASGKDRKSPTNSTHRLHTSFGLSPNGEYLGLYNNELPRIVISEFTPEYPEQRNDYSYGYDTTNSLKYFATPTPGAANGASAIAAVLPPPHFNVDRGMFETPFTLILSSPVPGASILYTTDGTEPALGSPSVRTYSQPLTVSITTVLRAAVFKSGMLPSVTVTHTYLFLDQVVTQPNRPVGFPTNWGPNSGFPGGFVPADYEMDMDPLRVDPNNTSSPIDAAKLQRLKDGLRELPIVSIVMKTDDIFGTAGIYQRSAIETGTPGTKPENKKPCSVEMILPDGTTAFTTTCGIDLHGNASRNPVKNPKHGFKLTFRGDFGPATLQYRLFEDSPVEEFDDIDLRADFNSSWRHWSDTAGQGLGAFQRTRATRTRDAWMKNSMRDMGGLASHNRFVHVYLNGLYWGTYDLSEDPSESFAKANLGGNDEDFDVVDQGYLKNGTINFYNAMSALPTATTLQQYEQYHQYLNVPEFIDYMLLHFFMGHQDWATAPTKNWAAVRKRVPGPEGTFRYLPWDGECILLNEDVNRVAVSPQSNLPTGLQPKLANHPEYRLAFADRIHKHMIAPGGALVSATNQARWQKWQDIMDKPIVAESARWGDYRRDVHQSSEGVYQLYTRENHWVTENNRMRGYFSNRNAIVLGQLRVARLYPSNAAPVFSQQGGRVPRGFNLTMTATNTIYYTLDGSDPRVYGTGAVSPQAQTYTSAVTLTNSVIVKARALFGTNWSALNEAAFNADALGVPLRITEIMYNPVGGDAYEYVELQNVGSVAINVGGFSFDGFTFVFPPNTVLAPGQTIVLGSDESPANWNARYPGVTAFGRFDGSLANGGEKLALKDANANIVHSVDYDDENGWATQPDGGGYSLQIVDVFADPDDPANWRTSDAVNGTPGTQVGPPPTGPVVINEVMAENLSAVPNGSTYPDWIEIRNAGGSPVNLQGWSLSDDGNARKFVFPSTTIPANGYLVVWCDSTTNTTPGLHTGFALGRNGESIFLYNASTVRVDSVSFGLQLANYSVGRIASTWRLTTPTPNAANAVAALGASTDLVINEWLANAAPGASDWVELHNRSASPVSLDGIYLGNDDTIFQFSALSFIAPGGFAQILADELAGADHVDFKLAADAGFIVLYDEAGEERDRVSYGSQIEGVSQGRLPDGSGNIVSFPISPSPGASNYLLQYSGARINEVLAINDSVVTNSAGRTADWIELRNTNSTALNLSGMRLSTDASDPAQWIFPAGVSIPANGYLIVWFDNERAASTTAGSLLNTGHSLDGESGDVYLFNASGQAVDSVQYGFQIPDRSIGVSGAGWTLLAIPTPGTANSAAAALGSAAALRLNEWMADSEVEDDWFELYNNSDQAVALDGVYVTDNLSIAGATQSPLAPLSFIGARGFVRIIADADRNKGRHHAAFNLDALGEALRVYVPALGSVDAVYFDEQEPGVSQGRIPDGGDNFVSFGTTSTPAESNYLPAPNAAISEVLTHTDLPLEDAIEIINPSSTATNIGGWYLSDSSQNFKKYRIPTGTTLNPFGFKVIYENDLTSGAGALVPFTLDSVRGDTIHLSAADANGNLTGYRSVVRFGAAFNGVTFGRYVTTVGADFPALEQRSFGVDNPSTVTQFRTGTGAANAYPRVGPVVLNEVMFHPPGIGTNDNTVDEYIELHNVTTSAITLYDPAYPTNTWRLRGGVDFEFPGSVTLSSRAFVLVVSFNPVTNTAALNAFRAAYSIPASIPIFGPYRGKLDNGSEEVELYRPDAPQSSGPEAGFVPYILVDRLVYGDEFPWPFTADGGGASLQRQRPDEYGNDPVNWTGEGLSPGRPNVPGSTYTDADADGLSDQWEAANGFSSASQADADMDADGDGETNLQEYWAGTNPRSGSSYLVAPTITSHPQSATGVAGFDVTLSVAANGSAPLSYKWRFNGRDVAGATNTSLILSNLQPEQAGVYEAVAMNGRGYAVSQPAVLVIYRPAQITQQPVSQVVTNGTNVTFSVAAIGTGTIRYQWQFNGVDIPGATGTSYPVINPQLHHSGEYRVRVTDDIATIFSDPATLEVRMRPIIVEQPASQTVTVGSTLTLSIRVQGSTPIGYRWRRSGLNLTNIVLNDTNCTLVIPNAQTNHSGSYAVIITNAAYVTPGIQSALAIVNVVPVSADSDGDGMPDDWETLYNFNVNSSADALQDADGDLMTNLQEYNAGTNPRDPLSYLRLRLIRSGGSSLTFNAVANRTYTIEYRDTLSPGAWQVLQSVPAGPNREVQLNDAAGGNTRFYRLRTP
jgi:hypothetical protein